MKIQSQLSQILLWILASLHSWKFAEGFISLQPSSRTSISSRTDITDLEYSKDGGGDGSELFDRKARKELTQRIQSVQRDILEEEWRRPPHPGCSPEELIDGILSALWDSDDPLPDSGFLLLLRTATKKWRAQILKSIGAPTTQEVDWQLVSSALGAAIGRPRNQFGLLVAGEGNEENEIPYVLDFPFEALDYDDGTAWLECQMRDKKTNELLVVTGWTLQQRDDGAWLVDAVTWHDLRDEFRPGVGQTEWMRVCR